MLEVHMSCTFFFRIQQMTYTLCDKLEKWVIFQSSQWYWWELLHFCQ